MKAKYFLILALAVLSIFAAGCVDADVASENVSRAADNFEINRRIVFYNGISGEYILVIEGFCSLGNYDAAGSLSVICKYSSTEYKQNYLGLSDNVTYFAEQIDSAQVDAYHYRVFFKPSVIIPDVDFKP